MLNSFTELLLPDKGNTFLFDKNKPFGQTATFGIARAIPESGKCFYILLLFNIKSRVRVLKVLEASRGARE